MLGSDIKVLFIDLGTQKLRIEQRADLNEYMGGVGVAIRLFEEAFHPELPPLHESQPIVFAVGALTSVFPVMTKTVAVFYSPHTGELGEKLCRRQARVCDDAGGLRRNRHQRQGEETHATSPSARTTFPSATRARSGACLARSSAASSASGSRDPASAALYASARPARKRRYLCQRLRGYVPAFRASWPRRMHGQQKPQGDAGLWHHADRDQGLSGPTGTPTARCIKSAPKPSLCKNTTTLAPLST